MELKHPPRRTAQLPAECVGTHNVCKTPMAPTRRDWIDTECPECGVIFHGPTQPKHGGFCGANCAADAAEPVEAPEPAPTVDEYPTIKVIRLDWCEGPTYLCEELQGTEYTTAEEFDSTLAKIRATDCRFLKVGATLELTNGDTFRFRPDQHCLQHDSTSGSETVCGHFRMMRDGYLRMADKGDTVYGIGPEQWAEKAAAYADAILALGV